MTRSSPHRFEDAPNPGALQAMLIVEELVRAGVCLFVVAPGSRSAPLAVAIARHPRATRIVCLDERDAAFCALGAARATGRPAVVVTTSGTAVANCMPAVVEADVDHVPLIVLTADRPPELRATGANQTIEQAHLFGGRVRLSLDLACADAAISLAVTLTTMCQVVRRATGAEAGPVHVNVMFREPLAPVAASWDRAALEPLRSWTASARPFTRHHTPRLDLDAAARLDLHELVARAERGVVVAGRLDLDERAAAARITTLLGWPVVADVLSGLRLSSDVPALVPFADGILQDVAFGARTAPDVVLQLGGAPVSKRVAQWMQAARPHRHVVVARHGARLDPAHDVTDRFEADLDAFADALAELRAPASSLREPLIARSTRIAAALHEALDEDDARPVTEPYVARALTRHLASEAALFLGSSMPIRDVDQFGALRDPGLAARIGSNRGASGIDGLVASAIGFALGTQRPTTLLIGDLSLLHDVGGLGLLQACNVPLTIVVLNNGGGGIFSFLPIAGHDDVFERFFATPHDVSFVALAQAHQVAFHAPATRRGFLDALSAAAASGQHAIIEVRTDRRENLAVHEALKAGTLAAMADLQ